MGPKPSECKRRLDRFPIPEGWAQDMVNFHRLGLDCSKYCYIPNGNIIAYQSQTSNIDTHVDSDNDFIHFLNMRIAYFLSNRVR